MGLFYALTLGTRTMAAQQDAMEVTGHNLANVNTPGYSRQRVTFTTATPQTILTPSGAFQIGSGVEISAVNRVHDDYLEAQIQSESHDMGYYDATYSNYKIIETTFNEPSDNGISNALDEFWQSWQKLASPSPADKSTREEVKVKAINLTDSIKQTYNSINDLQQSVDSAIYSKITDINSNLDKLASINNQIANVPLDMEPSDLLDQRDNLLLDIAKQMNFTTVEQPNHTVDLSLGGIPLVVDNKAYHLTTTPTGQSQFRSILDSSNQKIDDQFTNGEMAALLNVRDNVLKDYKDNLDTLASTVMAQVNTLHRQGYDLTGAPGIDFFTGTGAGNIDIQPSIKENVNYIAASSSKDNLIGNGDIAKQIGDLQDATVFDNNNFSAGEYYQNMISKQANDSSYAKKLMDSQQTLLAGLNERKASVSGVSIDEEMTRLTQYQQSYAAAAKFVGVINDTIETMMSIIGG